MVPAILWSSCSQAGWGILHWEKKSRSLIGYCLRKVYWAILHCRLWRISRNALTRVNSYIETIDLWRKLLVSIQLLWFNYGITAAHLYRHHIDIGYESLLREPVRKKIREFLGVFPIRGGGVSPNPKTFVIWPSNFWHSKIIWGAKTCF